MTGTVDAIGSREKTSLHILLMEDEVHVARGLQMVMAEEGHTVEWAETGQSALEKLREETFDLLLADLRLPDMNGMDVIRHVKKEYPELEVVVITGYATLGSTLEALKIGARDYLAKPFTDEEIKNVVHEVRRTRREAAASGRPGAADTHAARWIVRREVLRVLNRTADDAVFWKDLEERGAAALEDYKLTPEAIDAILNGDLQWINENVGELNQKQLLFLVHRMERDAA